MSSQKVKNVCAVRSCLRTYEHKNISLFRFPKDYTRCKKWATVCNRLDLFSSIQDSGSSMYASYYRVCSMHFEDVMFTNTNKNRLKPDVIPTLNLEEARSSAVARATSPEITFKIEPLSEEEYEDKFIINAAPTRSPNSASDMKAETSCEEELEEAFSRTSTVTSTQTDQLLSSNTPRKQSLRKKVKALKNKVFNLQKKLDEKNQLALVDAATSEDVKQIIVKHFPSGLATFLIRRYELYQKRDDNRSYTEEFKYLCLNIYFLGPKCYSFLEKIFTLPSKITLFRLINDIKLKPGINDIVFNILKIKVDSMDSRDRLCILCFDEISIKSHLYLNITKDEIVGFEDAGNGKKFQPALNALVVMVKGILNNWKQPLAYFLANNNCSFPDLKIILTDVVLKLRQIGLIVKVCVSNNIKLSNALGIQPETPYFYIESNKIIYLFDLPRLIKALRNTLYSNNFFINGAFVSWKHIEDMYNIDKKLSKRLAPKLTDSHVHPTRFSKKKVSLATEILSASVANALGVLIALGHISAEASETQRFIEMCDNLFDLFNSNNLDSPKPFNRAFEGTVEQMQFLNDTKTYLKSIKIVNNKGQVITNKFRSIQCCQITINSLLELWDTLKCEGYSFISTRRLNQDVMELFFDTIRKQGGKSVNPTPIQFCRAFQKLFSLKLLNSGAKNCREDHAEILARFEDFQSENIFENNTLNPTDLKSMTIKLSLHIDVDYRFHDIENNSIRYICGYLIRKCLVVHSCKLCEEFANANEDLDEATLLRNFKAYKMTRMQTFGDFFMPHDDFFYYICELEEVFKNNFETYAVGKNVVKAFLNLFQSSRFIHPCSEFPYEYLLKLYCRMRIYYCLKRINNNFKSIDGTGEKTIVWRRD